MATLISDKMDLKTRIVSREIKMNVILRKSNNSSRSHNNYKCLCTKEQSLKLHETETDRIEPKKRKLV